MTRREGSRQSNFLNSSASSLFRFGRTTASAIARRRQRRENCCLDKAKGRLLLAASRSLVPLPPSFLARLSAGYDTRNRFPLWPRPTLKHLHFSKRHSDAPRNFQHRELSALGTCIPMVPVSPARVEIARSGRLEPRSSASPAHCISKLASRLPRSFALQLRSHSRAVRLVSVRRHCFTEASSPKCFQIFYAKKLFFVKYDLVEKELKSVHSLVCRRHGFIFRRLLVFGRVAFRYYRSLRFSDVSCLAG